MKFVNSIPFGRFGPRGFCRDEGPYDPLYARGAAPREQVVRLGFCSPHLGALRPSTPGDFPVAGKVTKGAPRASPFGIPRCEIFALFALAYASRRAGLCHRKRPMCPFEVVGKPVFVVSFGFDQEKYSAVNPWRGSTAGRGGCTFGCNFWGDSGYR